MREAPLFSLRCTKKLLTRMRTAPTEAMTPPTTVLGAWYANLLYIERRQLVLAVSERTLLPVLLPAADARSLPSRLPRAVAEMLAALRIPHAAIERELAQMETYAIGATANRRVLGTMNDFAWMMEASQERSESLLSTALFLAESPCGPIKMASPRDVVVEAFAASVH